MCKTCWSKWGKDLWEGCCVCTGDVDLSKPPPNPQPLPPKKTAEFKVTSYGDRFIISKVEADGESHKVGPMFDKGMGRKGLSFPKELYPYNYVFNTKEEADKILSKLLEYFKDLEQKNKKDEHP